MVRTLLAESKLPQRFWAEALSTAAYLRNMSPTKPVDGMTPYEALTGRKPNVSHLRTFGCVVYAHVPKDERKKLDNTSKKCLLMGYGENVKGYRLYDPQSGKMFYSRDCVFHETEFGLDKEFTTEEPIKYVVLDLPEITLVKKQAQNNLFEGQKELDEDLTTMESGYQMLLNRAKDGK